jgi:hypothetical protein
MKSTMDIWVRGTCPWGRGANGAVRILQVWSRFDKVLLTDRICPLVSARSLHWGIPFLTVQGFRPGLAVHAGAMISPGAPVKCANL